MEPKYTPSSQGTGSSGAAPGASLTARFTGDLSAGQEQAKTPFRPRPVTDIASTGLNVVFLESLVVKFLLSVGIASGRRIAHELGLPFAIFPDLLRQFQNRKLVSLSAAAAANDFDYALTDAGRARAMSYMEECAYVGTAPVPFADYVAAVAAQSLTAELPKRDDLRRAFADLLVSEEMLATLGPAINSGQGMFIFGAPGNGKTSIAERVTQCFGRTIWIPRTIEIEGQIVKLFDPSCHEPVAVEPTRFLRQESSDARWVEIKRPTISAGGELTMDNLEIRHDPLTRVSEAPFQMKSNNGTFLIDDFGRQKMPPGELLNRWIVPLEKHYDFLTLANGKKVKMPFDQLIIFSTNLEPARLVDEAFLRRIPYKIKVSDPTEEQFLRIFRALAPHLGFKEVNEPALDYLLQRYYRDAGRALRYCQPRDLLLQVRNHCIYNDLPLELKPEYFDVAADNYFSGMSFAKRKRRSRQDGGKHHTSEEPSRPPEIH
jgi:hypothetical protein